MDFICYLHPGWDPLVRPAEATRPWMDDTNESFAYRCLPLNIANAHGWEILSPCDVDAYWTGGSGKEAVILKNAPGTPTHQGAVTIFGHGVLTFHIEALFRTPPGWDLFIMGSPNRPKEGISPLSGIVEADWSPYTFTMNWKFTRRNHWIRFKRGEPICMVFPVQRGMLERMDPKVVDLEDAPELMEDFQAWTKSRNAFFTEMLTKALPSERWQKRYYRGIGMRDENMVKGHRARLRLKPFVQGEPAPEATLLTLDEGALARLLTAANRGVPPEELTATLLQAGVPGDAAARIVTSCLAAMEAAGAGG